MTNTKWVKPTTEYVPLVIFFIAYQGWGLMPATAALMVATLAALVLSLAIERKVPLMPVITAAIVGLFGGLTLWLQDDTFIKMKPTIIQLLFAAVLGFGLVVKRLFLKTLLGAALPMDDDGWRKLTWRFVGFFTAMAVVNEVVWRTQSTDFWVNFKVFGLMAVTMVFMLAQTPLVNRHKVEPSEG